MADKIIIEGLKPYDGEYEFDIAEQPLTTLEWRWIKKIAGYLPLTMQDGFRGGDPDLFLVFAVIALCRNGKVDPTDVYRVADRLADEPTTAITMSFEEREQEEADEDHPRLASVSESNK
jgi:hypothetical protein